MTIYTVIMSFGVSLFLTVLIYFFNKYKIPKKYCRIIVILFIIASLTIMFGFFKEGFKEGFRVATIEHEKTYQLF